jgi:hypothetical protein
MSYNNFSPDLTQRPPRSPRVRLGGFVLLPRILDKGRASLIGKLGEYHYAGEGLDQHFFTFMGLDHEALKRELAKGATDSEVLAWVHAHAKHSREAWEIEAWSEHHMHRGPSSDTETLLYFSDEVKRLSPTREDIHTWFDYLDLDDYCCFGGKP